MIAGIYEKVQCALLLFCICCYGGLIEKCPATLQGHISPELQFVYFGQRINLTCQLSSDVNGTKLDAKDLYFLASKTKSNSSDRIIKGSPNIWKLSENQVEISISDNSGVYNTTSHEARYVNYVCIYNSTEPCAVQYRYIEIDYKPKAVQDGRCIVENWQRMECSWDLGVVYRHLNNLTTGTTRITVAYEYNASVEFSVTSETWSRCPKLLFKGQIASCIFESDTGKDSLKLGQYYFIITVNNTKSLHSVQKRTTINNLALVKPAPVENLQAAVNKTFVTMRWDSSYIHRAKLFRIKYKSRWTDHFKEKNITGTLNTANQQYILDGLEAYTDYFVTVCVIPVIDGKAVGYWSERRDIDLRTLEDVPSAVPNMDPGFFCCLNQDCSSLQIFWQPIKLIDMNGEIKKYRITIIAEEGSKNGKTNITVINFNDGSTNQAILDINSTVTNRIQLSQATRVGFPLIDDAFIIMPPYLDRLSVPKNLFIEALNNTYVNMTWDAPPESDKFQSIITYTQVWCQGSVATGCQGTVQSKVLLAKDGTTSVIHVGGLYSDYIYGISAETASRSGRIISSGLTWNHCTYVKNAVPKKPLIVQLLLDKKMAQGIRFKWREYTCTEDQMGVIQNYTIEYCIINKDICIENSVKKVTVNSSTNSFQIDNLDKGYTYNVWVMAGFPAGYTAKGEGARYTLYKPETQAKSEDGGVGYNVIIGCSVGVVAVILIIISVYKIRRCLQEADKSTKDIEIPEIPKSNGAANSHMSQNSTRDYELSEGRPLLEGGGSGAENLSGDTRLTESTMLDYTVSRGNNGFNTVSNPNSREMGCPETSGESVYRNANSITTTQPPGGSDHQNQNLDPQNNSNSCDMPGNDVSKLGSIQNNHHVTGGEMDPDLEFYANQSHDMNLLDHSSVSSIKPYATRSLSVDDTVQVDSCVRNTANVSDGMMMNSVDPYVNQTANRGEGLMSAPITGDYVSQMPDNIDTRLNSATSADPCVRQTADNSAGDLTSAGSVAPYVRQTADNSAGDLTSVGSVAPYVRQTADDSAGDLTSAGSVAPYVRQTADNSAGDLTSVGSVAPYVRQTADNSAGDLTSAGSVAPYVRQTADNSAGDLTSAGSVAPYVRQTADNSAGDLTSVGSVAPYVRQTADDSAGDLTSAGSVAPYVRQTADNSAGDLTSAGSVAPYVRQTADNSAGDLTSVGSVAPYVRQTADNSAGDLTSVGSVAPYVRQTADNSAGDLTSAGSVAPYVRQTADNSAGDLTSAGSVAPYVRQTAEDTSGNEFGLCVREMSTNEDSGGTLSGSNDPYIGHAGNDLEKDSSGSHNV